MNCNLCPRACNIDRADKKGVCGEGDNIRIALWQLHHYEEPVISGKNGSGAIFFSGCPLKCVFCQNNAISHNGEGKEYTVAELASIMLSLKEMGAHNINLVTPTHFADKILSALESVKHKLNIPVIYNCGGYESIELIRQTQGLVDVFLPDFKYFSSELAKAYSAAPDYFEKASLAIAEMLKIQPKVIIKDGLIKQGVIIRHLVLPGCADDSIDIMQYIAANFNNALVSIMRQYTPDFYMGSEKNLKRKITTYEYDKVISTALNLGLHGFMQSAASASSIFTPNFKST